MQNVQSELKRAKRLDDEEKNYREAVASSGTVQSVQQALTIAGNRGDVANVKALFEKLDKMQGPPKGRMTQFSPRNTYAPLGQAMAMRAQDKSSTT